MLKLKEIFCPIKKFVSSFALYDSNKPNLFGQHLSNIFKPHSNIIPSTTHLDKINIFLKLDVPLPMFIPTKHVSSKNMENVIQR